MNIIDSEFKRLKELEAENRVLKKHNEIFFNTIKEQINLFESKPLYPDGTHRIIVDKNTLEELKKVLRKAGYEI